MVQANLKELIGLELVLDDDTDLNEWHHLIERSELIYGIGSFGNGDLENFFRKVIRQLADVGEYWRYTSYVIHYDACFLVEAYPIQDAYTYRYQDIC